MIFRLTGKVTAADLVARLKAENILASSLGPAMVRLVTHRDVSRTDCVRAAEVLAEVIAGVKTT